MPEADRRFDRLVAVPFRQVTERGFVAHDDGTPLAVVDIATEREIPLDELIDALPDESVTFADEGGFETSDEDYGAVVERIIRDEIGNGEGANLVVGRHYRAQLSDWNSDRALTVLQEAADQRARRLLDLLLLDRRPVPDRRLAGAARQRARRRRADEPDLRHLPAARRSTGRPSARSGCWSSSPTRRRSTSSSWSSTRS